MENISEDIGEKVISQLKELIEMIEQKFRENEEQKLNLLLKNGNEQNN